MTESQIQDIYSRLDSLTSEVNSLKLLIGTALLNHGMISLNLKRVFNGFNRLFIPHLCNATGTIGTSQVAIAQLLTVQSQQPHSNTQQPHSNTQQPHSNTQQSHC
jgi:hypothetical protein